MTQRQIVISLHWANIVFLTWLIIAGPAAPMWLRVIYALVALGWVGTYALQRGPLARPGPKLASIAPAFIALHHGLYLCVAVAGLIALFANGLPWAGTVLGLVLSLGLLHGIFHLWRHTALRDGALRMITPKALHGIL